MLFFGLFVSLGYLRGAILTGAVYQSHEQVRFIKAGMLGTGLESIVNLKDILETN